MDAIAKTLNERGIRPARDGQWHVSSVANLLARARPMKNVALRSSKATLSHYNYSEPMAQLADSYGVPALY